MRTIMDRRTHLPGDQDARIIESHDMTTALDPRTRGMPRAELSTLLLH